MAYPSNERIDHGVLHIGRELSEQIYTWCGCYTIDGVCAKLGALQSATDIGKAVQTCCRSPRAGQVLPNGYKVPPINERGAKALLTLLCTRGAHHLEHVSVHDIRRMIDRMDSKRAAKQQQSSQR